MSYESLGGMGWDKIIVYLLLIKKKTGERFVMEKEEAKVKHGKVNPIKVTEVQVSTGQKKKPSQTLKNRLG